MRKEIIWAIVAGITFGLIITFGIIRINSSLNPKGITTEATPTPKSEEQGLKIALGKPENEDVVTESKITISGITKPSVNLLISGEGKDYMLQSGNDGLFEKEIDLISGVNQIRITAFGEDRSQSVEKVLVIYSSAFVEKEGDRLEKAANKPKAYLGTITDITNSTIQIKSTVSEIKQISVSETETVVKNDSTNKEVKLSDLAIGDFIVAMGYKNENQVLSAQRILITPPVVEPGLTVSFGRGKDITPAKSTSFYLFKNSETTKSKAAAMEDEAQIIYIASEVNSKSSIRSVFVIQ